MLPSRGFFKKNDCPFFEKGLCLRPHCHFRHRKKVVSENSSSVEDLLDSGTLVSSIKTHNDSESTTSNLDCENQHSNNTADNKSQESGNGSLFAKLVNQADPYEKISRHIPCAYTPTPQTKSVQPKNKSSGGQSKVNSSVVLKNASTLADSNKSIGDKLNDQYVPNKEETVNSVINRISSNLGREESSKCPTGSSIDPVTSVNSREKDSLFDSKSTESYEPKSISNSVSSASRIDQGDGDASNYVPSKGTTGESKYIPKSNESSLPVNYVPSKDKPKQTQYVPEGSGNASTKIAYKPSDKTSSGETQYEPDSTTCTTDYVPTEKSATNSNGSSWLNSKGGSDLSDLDFISSEIEMMKELLNEGIDDKEETGAQKSKTDIGVGEKGKESKDDKHHRSRDKSYRSHHSTRHKSDSSSSRHSSRSSSTSSRHHSSKHHSSSKLSDHHKSSRDSHRSSSSSHSHKSSGHSSSHKTNSKSKEKSRHHDNRKVRNESEDSDKRKPADGKSISGDENACDDLDTVETDLRNSSDENCESESEIYSKKRKNIWSDEDRKSKLLRKETEDLLDVLEDDAETVEKQCLEIFNNYTVPETNDQTKEIMIPNEEWDSVQAKKRTAHSTTILSDHSVLRLKTAKKTHKIKSAQEVMLERYKTIEKAKETSQPSVQPAPIPGLSRPSIRIAAVSNIQQMLKAKKAIQEKINLGLKVNERTTIAHTISHGSSRVAHSPISKDMAEKPTIKDGSKLIPRVKRQIYLDKLLLETNQIYPTKEESVQEALKLEEEIFRANSGSPSAYQAAFISLLLKTRRRLAAVKGEASRAPGSGPKMSHLDVLSGGKKNFSFIKTKKLDISMLSSRQIYEELLRCKLSTEELKENGYPVETGKPGYASCSLNFELKYNDKYIYIKKMTGNRRYCIRCSKQYEVHPVTLKQLKEGPETCSYHPGKKKSGGRNCDRIYNCCNTSSTEGCATHVRHVTDCTDYENLPNCVKTLSKNDESDPGVFALDCEMVYTSMGYELARVTVVNLKKEIVYDTLVKPKYPVECYNTFYSGIEENMLDGVKTTLKDVQAVLLSLFSNKTILIGHSLDSDLRALRLIHDTVVDTAIVYKNEKCHPYKYSLKELCAKKISKIIQDNVNGHDSAEDAVAALEIMLDHVKKEVGKYDSLESYEADRARD